MKHLKTTKVNANNDVYALAAWLLDEVSSNLITKVQVGLNTPETEISSLTTPGPVVVTASRY